MNNYNDEVFEFGNDSYEETNKTNEFNYDSISGLGESNYENEDLFNTEVSYDRDLNNTDNSKDENIEYNTGDFDSMYTDYSENYVDGIVPNLSQDSTQDESQKEETTKDTDDSDITFDINEKEENIESDLNLEDSISTANSNDDEEKTPDIEKNNSKGKKNDKKKESKSSIKLSDTPIEELNKLTEYKEDKIESSDISNLFDRVSVNFKDASEIFKKNTDLKQKIDSRFEELKKLQSEIESSRKKQLDEIDKYKEEVYGKLTSKKKK